MQREAEGDRRGRAPPHAALALLVPGLLCFAQDLELVADGRVCSHRRRTRSARLSRCEVGKRAENIPSPAFCSSRSILRPFVTSPRRTVAWATRKEACEDGRRALGELLQQIRRAQVRAGRTLVFLWSRTRALCNTRTIACVNQRHSPQSSCRSVHSL